MNHRLSAGCCLRWLCQWERNRKDEQAADGLLHRFGFRLMADLRFRAEVSPLAHQAHAHHVRTSSSLLLVTLIKAKHGMCLPLMQDQERVGRVVLVVQLRLPSFSQRNGCGKVEDSAEREGRHEPAERWLQDLAHHQEAQGKPTSTYWLCARLTPVQQDDDDNEDEEEEEEEEYGYRYFRLLCTGTDTTGSEYLALSGFEIYGKVAMLE